jgi:Cdc6-like AAA superfamily ATPase
MDLPQRNKNVIMPSSSRDGEVTRQYFKHSSSKRLNSDAVLATALKKQYPSLKLSMVSSWAADLLGYAATGNASYTELEDETDGGPTSLAEKVYVPPSQRMGGGTGFVGERISFGKFLYKFKGDEFIMYLAEAQDGVYDIHNTYYILSTDESKVNTLIRDAGLWASQLHEEIWVFDGGFWRKDPGLYASVMKASWDAVILDPDMKKSLIDDHLSFFRSRETYQNLKVPWKRGIIYYGPPGNGKTISIKAMMHSLYTQEPEVPTLYVRSLRSVRSPFLFNKRFVVMHANHPQFFGPEDSIKQIFAKARQFAPCYLVFEDLDSLVSDQVRSYFLNEVDGLQSNDGIFMIGSTNHLERLDPGISVSFRSKFAAVTRPMANFV